MPIYSTAIRTRDGNWTRWGGTIEIRPSSIGRIDIRIVATDYSASYVQWEMRAIVSRYAEDPPAVQIVSENPSTHALEARLAVNGSGLLRLDVKGIAGVIYDWLLTTASEDFFIMTGADELMVSSTLLDGLVGYWKLDETSGVRYDSTVNANHLTDNNTVGSTTGIISNAASCVALNSEYLSVADNDSLSVEDQDFTASFWINLADFLVFNGPCGKSGAGASGEWACYINMGTGTVQMYILSGGAVQKDLTGPTITAGSWNHVLLDYVSSSKAMSIAVNNGTPTTGTNTGVNPVASTASFEIGRVVGGNYLNGSVDELGFWKRILTTDERTALYNSGAGLTYPF